MEPDDQQGNHGNRQGKSNDQEGKPDDHLGNTDNQQENVDDQLHKTGDLKSKWQGLSEEWSGNNDDRQGNYGNQQGNNDDRQGYCSDQQDVYASLVNRLKLEEWKSWQQKPAGNDVSGVYAFGQLDPGGEPGLFYIYLGTSPDIRGALKKHLRPDNLSLPIDEYLRKMEAHMTRKHFNGRLFVKWINETDLERIDTEFFVKYAERVFGHKVDFNRPL